MSTTTTINITKHAAEGDGSTTFTVQEVRTTEDAEGNVETRQLRNILRMATLDQIQEQIDRLQADLDKWTQIKTDAEAL